MPRMINYKPNSIIYFTNDKADSVFLLKEGKVNLVYNDILSGEQVSDSINNGEFFGVKSGLVKFPREETAKVLVNSTVIEFTSSEFEALITNNTNIIIKMLRSFSNQLRRVGKQVQSFVTDKMSSDPSADFFQIGNYYLKNKKYQQAISVYKRFLIYYQEGALADHARKRLATAEEALKAYGEGGGPTPMLEDISENQVAGVEEGFQGSTSGTTDMSSDEVKFYNGISLINKKRYKEAFSELKDILSSSDRELANSAKFEVGRCLYFLNSIDKCLEVLLSLTEKAPNFNKMGDVLYYIALCHKKSGSTGKAEEYFKRAMAKSSEGDELYRLANDELKELL